MLPIRTVWSSSGWSSFVNSRPVPRTVPLFANCTLIENSAAALVVLVTSTSVTGSPFATSHRTMVVSGAAIDCDGEGGQGVHPGSPCRPSRPTRHRCHRQDRDRSDQVDPHGREHRPGRISLLRHHTRPLVTSVEPRGRMITDWVSAEQLRPVVSHRTASLYVKNAKQAEQEGRL
jgi:hypothetical protein